MQLATVQLTYYDESGKAYSSHYNDVVGSFKIVSTTPYNENEAGQPTTRFFFETEAVLKSSDGSTLELKDTFGSFAVAHP
ncbi:MAG: hypothetical protein U5L96_16110 [Owenweeksia sp.]|nr:hypothetical protein [Owenweeksia sp.]